MYMDASLGDGKWRWDEDIITKEQLVFVSQSIMDDFNVRGFLPEALMEQIRNKYNGSGY